jgi:peroxiredoxin
MGRLDDIIERNQRAQQVPRSFGGAFVQAFLREIGDVFDPKVPRHVRKRKATALAVTFGLVAAVVALALVWLDGRDAAQRKVGGIVIDRSGQRVELTSLWRDRPAILVFFSGFTCEGCQERLQELGALGREHDVVVAAVAFDSHGIEAMRDAVGPQVPLYTASSMALLKAWKIPWQSSDDTGPAMYVVGADDEVTYRKTCHGFMGCSLRAELAPAFVSAAKLR